MGVREFSISVGLVVAFLGAASGCALTPGEICPAGTADDGTGTNNCVSSTTTSNGLGVPLPLGAAQSGFYYMGTIPLGFVLGNGTAFSITDAANASFVPDVSATFGGGPMPSSSVGQITEAFTAVAVYNQAQAAAADYYEIEDSTAVTGPMVTFDPITGTNSDLTGYIVAVGYSLTPSGYVVPLIARFTPRGALDTTFNTTGYELGTPGQFTGGSFAVFTSVAIDNVGNIVVGGYANQLPTISNYLATLQADNGDPTTLGCSTSSGGVCNATSGSCSVCQGDSLVGVVARYLPNGGLDPTFSTANENLAPGSAISGYATSPSSTAQASGGASAIAQVGFANVAPPGKSRDVVMGVAVDSSNGIIAVGGSMNAFDVTKNTTYELAFIAHYASTGALDSYQVGNGLYSPLTNNYTPSISSWTTADQILTDVPPASQTPNNGVSGQSQASGNYFFKNGLAGSYFFERFTSITAVTGPTGFVVGGVVQDITAHSNLGGAVSFALNNPGLGTEYIAPSPLFTGSSRGTAIAPLTAQGTFDYITSVAYDPAKNNVVLAGSEGAYSTSGTTALVAVIPIATAGSPVYYTSPAGGFADGAGGGAGEQDSILGIAPLVGSSGAVTDYFAVGQTLDAYGHSRSLLAAISNASLTASGTLSGSVLDTAVNANPYYASAGTGIELTQELPPYTNNGPPPACFVSSVTGFQTGPASPTTGSYATAEITVGGVLHGAFEGALGAPFSVGTGTDGGSAYGGGSNERFNAVTTSPDGQHAVVVGFTTDAKTTNLPTTSPPIVGPLIGRSFPILLFYNIDGSFPDMAQFPYYSPYAAPSPPPASGTNLSITCPYQTSSNLSVQCSL